MKYVGLLLALAGLVFLSLVDWIVNPLLRPSLGWWPAVGPWGLICALLLVLSMWVMRVEESYRVRIKGSALGFASPFLALFIGHGLPTVLWLYLPMMFGFGIHWMLNKKQILRAD